jgi:hypothetical protein
MSSTEKTRYVRFLATSAGPDYTASPGDIIGLPRDEAKMLVMGRYAEYVEKSEFEAAGGNGVEAKESGPEPEEWPADLLTWAKWRNPRAYQQLKANPAFTITIDYDPDYERERPLHEEAVKILEDNLREDVRSGKLVILKRQDGSPDGPWDQPGPQEAHVIMKRVNWGPMGFSDWSHLQKLWHIGVIPPLQFDQMKREKEIWLEEGDANGKAKPGRKRGPDAEIIKIYDSMMEKDPRGHCEFDEIGGPTEFASA